MKAKNGMIGVDPLPILVIVMTLFAFSNTTLHEFHGEKVFIQVKE